MDPGEEVKPWERQWYETSNQYRVFHEFYLSQSAPRSLARAYRDYLESKKSPIEVVSTEVHGWEDLVNAEPAQDLPPKKKPLKQASTRFKYWAHALNNVGKPIPGGLTWDARASAWDEHLADETRQKWMARYESQREQDWSASNQLRELAVATLLAKQVEPGRIDHLARAIELAAKIGRLATGEKVISEPAESEEDKFAGLSDAERSSRIAALLDLARTRRAGQASDREQAVGSERRRAD